MPNPLCTPRDWQAIALREAVELAGTPEGAAKLIEAKRYGMLADEIDSLMGMAQYQAEARRWRCVRASGSGLTLQLHNTRSDARDELVDNYIKAHSVQAL